jgi:hypothetical protein
VGHDLPVGQGEARKRSVRHQPDLLPVQIEARRGRRAHCRWLVRMTNIQRNCSYGLYFLYLRSVKAQVELQARLQ